MKKLFSSKAGILALVSALVLGFVFVPGICIEENLVSAKDSVLLKGDMDNDGVITATDARLVLRTSVGLEDVQFITPDDFGGTQPDTPVGKMPSTTKEITDFYKKGVDDIKTGKAGYTKKEWQNVDAVNIGGSLINNAVTGVLGSFMTVEADAAEQVNLKGSDEAKNRIAAWTLTDLSKVKSATCVADGSNYKITIIMQDEDTPKKNGSVLGQVTGALLYWEDIEATLKNDPTVTKILKSFSGIHVIYKGYKIEAVMTPDGKFISIDHIADIDIIIGEAKILNMTIRDKYGHMWNYCKFYDFRY